MTVLATAIGIERALERDDRRGVALLAKDLDDAVLISGGYGGQLPSLIKVLQSPRFRKSAAAWHVLRAIEGNSNLLLSDEREALAPIIRDILSTAEDELTRYVAYELQVSLA